MARSRWRTWTLSGVVLVLVAGAGALVAVTRNQAHLLITNPRATRKMSHQTPADFGMPFQDVAVRSADGLSLVGWFVPSDNGAVIIAQHGYKDSRDSMLRIAALLHRHGYGVLIDAVRAHDGSDGETLTFGHDEMKDLDAFFADLTARPGVDANRIAIFGGSMGGALAIRYAAVNPRVKAVLADCAFSSITDTVGTSVRFFTGLPAFPFGPMIMFWTEREEGFSVSDLDTTRWVGRISPRPLFLLQGGADVVISPSSGQLLYDAAGEPKELWFDPALGHVQFLSKHPEEFERRVTAFFDHALGVATTR